jgi:hypothetical protein
MGLKKLFSLAILFVLVSTLGFSQAAQRIVPAIQNPVGGGNFAKLGPNASVFVCTYNAQLTCNSGNYTNIYKDVTLLSPITQPVVADLNGVYQYFINSGTNVVEKVCFTASQCQSYPIYFNAGGGGGGGVPSINGITTATTIAAGSNVTVGTSGNTITINSTGGGVSQIIAGTNVTVSPTGGTGAVTINASGGSGGVQYNPPNTVYMWGAGDSSISDDGLVYGGSTTATAANCNGTVCIITAPNSYAAGQTIWIDGTWSPSFLNTVTAPQYLGTGHGFYQVISTGLSSTQFEFAYTSASGTGTGGTVRDTSYMVPFLSGSMPFLNGHGTTIVEVGQESGQGFTIQASLDNFSALYGSYAPNVTGNPGFFFISGWKNDVGVLNESASTVVSNIQSLMALAHASGWQVVAMTEWTSVNGGTMALSYMAQINSDILQLGKTNANASSGQYWDYIVDAASGVTDTSLTYTPSTVPLIAAKVNEAFASQKSATTGLSTMFSLDTGLDTWRMQGNNGLEICAANNPVCMLTVGVYGNTTSVNNFNETQTANVNDRGGTGVGSPILVSNPSSYYPTSVTEYFPNLSAGQYGSMLYAFDQIGDYFSLHLENTGSESIFGISGSPESHLTPTDILQVFANGDVAIPAEAPFAGYAACFTTGGTMGHCTSIIGATGTCTCVTP